MNPRLHRNRTALSLLSTLSLTVCLSACGVLGGTGGDSDPTTADQSDDITVGLLLPDRDTARFDKFDHPLIKKRVAALTHGKGKVVYANAEGSTAKQSAQFGKLIADKADVILVDAVDAGAVAPDVRKAEAAGIPVIAYDRLAEGPIDAYVSHDNELVGEVQGRALVEKLGDAAETSKVVMMHGEPADPNSALFKKGALTELEGQVDIVRSYNTEKWLPKAAAENMRKAIRAVGLNNIAAVYSANDGMAGAVIDALKEAGATDLPPVTGQDADLAAVRRIIAGEQYMSVYKPFVAEASAAAEMAVARVKGRDIQFDSLTRERVDSPTQKDIPAMLVPVVALTKKNIDDTVIKDGVYTVEELCTPQYADDCAQIGLTS